MRVLRPITWTALAFGAGWVLRVPFSWSFPTGSFVGAVLVSFAAAALLFAMTLVGSIAAGAPGRGRLAGAAALLWLVAAVGGTERAYRVAATEAARDAGVAPALATAALDERSRAQLGEPDAAGRLDWMRAVADAGHVGRRVRRGPVLMWFGFVEHWLFVLVATVGVAWLAGDELDDEDERAGSSGSARALDEAARREAAGTDATVAAYETVRASLDERGRRAFDAGAAALGLAVGASGADATRTDADRPPAGSAYRVFPGSPHWYPTDRIPTDTFIDAVYRRDPAALTALVAEGVGPDVDHPAEGPMLIQAVRNASVEVFERLLDLGADPRVRGPIGGTVLHDAAAKPEAVHVLPRLVAAGLDVDVEDDHGRTPLMTAFWCANDAAIEWLLAHDADVHHRDREGETMLHRLLGAYGAARDREDADRRLRWVDRLLEAGLDPNRPGWLERTPLEIAAAGRDARVVERLLDAGADPERTSRGAAGLLQSAAAAARGGHVDLLVARGVDLDWWTALLLDRTECLGPMLDADPSLASAVHPDGRRSSLGLALRHGGPGRVRWLLERGAQADVPGVNGGLVIEALRADCATSLVRDLLQAGAPPNAADGNGATPLHVAAGRGDAELVRVLLAFGADPSAVTHRGEPVLGPRTTSEVRRLLVAAGARDAAA